MNLNIKKLKEDIAKSGIIVHDDMDATHLRLIPDHFSYSDIVTYIGDMGKQNFAFHRQQSLTGMDGIVYTILYFRVW